LKGSVKLISGNGDDASKLVEEVAKIINIEALGKIVIDVLEGNPSNGTVSISHDFKKIINGNNNSSVSADFFVSPLFANQIDPAEQEFLALFNNPPAPSPTSAPTRGPGNTIDPRHDAAVNMRITLGVIAGIAIIAASICYKAEIKEWVSSKYCKKSPRKSSVVTSEERTQALLKPEEQEQNARFYSDGDGELGSVVLPPIAIDRQPVEREGAF
jgi:hypothetical protein